MNKLTTCKSKTCARSRRLDEVSKAVLRQEARHREQTLPLFQKRQAIVY